MTNPAATLSRIFDSLKNDGSSDVASIEGAGYRHRLDTARNDVWTSQR